MKKLSTFLKHNISLDKHKGLIGALIGTIIALISVLFLHSYYALLFILIGFMIGVLTFKTEKPYIITTIYILLMLLGISISSQMVLTDQYYFDIGYTNVLLNILVVGIVFIFFFLITLRERISTLCTMIITLLLSVTNYYIYTFRGNELMPLDLFSWQTAANVASGYKLNLTEGILYGVGVCIMIYFAGFMFKSIKLKQPIKSRIFVLVLEVVMVAFFAYAGLSVNMRTWQDKGTTSNGYLLNFAVQIETELMAIKPTGYSYNEIENLESEYYSQTDTGKHPDIIVIMNESFADLNVLGNLSAYEEVIPFYNSLNKNTIKGHALASVYGGGTSNSEFEFLTGNTVSFLPLGSTAYQLYLKQKTHSMVQELKSMNYQTFATHPYHASGWSRSSVYPLLGFDECTFMEDYPKKNLLRGFISDQEMYEYMIKKYESQKDKGPVFQFGVTIQNHGPFTTSGSDIPRIHLKGYEYYYSDVEQYLGLIHESDQAFKYLINYFKKQDRDVVVCMFGDHLPGLSKTFYEELHGREFLKLQDIELKYKVPFVIWTSYDSDERKVDCTSLNYLANYVYEAAGIDLPAYRSFLQSMEEVIPAINYQGYYSKSAGSFIKIEDAEGEERNKINQYKILQYNNLFDKKHKSQIFFPLP